MLQLLFRSICMNLNDFISKLLFFFSFRTLLIDLRLFSSAHLTSLFILNPFVHRAPYLNEFLPKRSRSKGPRSQYHKKMQHIILDPGPKRPLRKKKQLILSLIDTNERNYFRIIPQKYISKSVTFDFGLYELYRRFR